MKPLIEWLDSAQSPVSVWEHPLLDGARDGNQEIPFPDWRTP